MKATRRRLRAALLVASALASLPLAAAAQSGGMPRAAAPMPKAAQPPTTLAPPQPATTLAPQPTTQAPQPTTQAPQPTTQAPQPTTQVAASNPPRVAVPPVKTPRQRVEGTAHDDAGPASVRALAIDSEAPPPQPGALAGQGYPGLNAPLDTVAVGNALAGGSPPPATLRAYSHVFIAFAVAWLLVFGYALSIGRRFGKLEAEVEKLERPS
jgi:CcmD family protein